VRPWGIKQKVLALALLPGILIGLVLYAYFLYLQLGLLDQSLRERGQAIASQLAPASEFGVATGNTQLLALLATALLEQPDISGIALFDHAGFRLVTVGRVETAPRFGAWAERETGLCLDRAGRLVFCAPIQRTRLQVSDFELAIENTGTDEAIGYVAVEISTRRIEQRRRAAVLQTLLITGIVLALAGFLAWRMARRISGPLLEITTAVEAVTHGDLARRLPVSGEREIGRLQEGINTMIGALRSGRDEMQQRVDQATARLRGTLEELEHRNRELERQREKAQDANAAKSRFLANMSHEIRTPVSGITGMLTLLEETRLSSDQKTYVHNLTLATRALRALIDDLLDLARIEARKFELERIPFDLRGTVEEVTVMLAPSAHEKEVELVCDFAPELPVRVVGDALHLRQVLINLVANAIKFTDAGEVVLRVTHSTEAEGWLHFAISDTGIGIPEDQHESIFESFVQIDTANSSRYGGTGLGTTISRELVNLMGGRIGLSSRPGHGSLFWFALPLPPAEEQPPASPRWTDGSGAPRILVLERNRASRKSLCHCLTALGLRVDATDEPDTVVARAVAAVEAGESLQLLLLAENRRAPHYLTLARQIRERLGEEAPLLCHATLFNTRSAPEQFDYLLTKPITHSALAECVQSLLHPLGTGIRVEAREEERVQRPLRVLIAEDNAINALVIARLLERSGHRTQVAENGREALAALERASWDIVFMDMRMPEMDGLEVTRRWRAQELPAHHLPIIALTANATTEDRDRCLEAGMDDFIAKPVSAEQLTKSLARWTE